MKKSLNVGVVFLFAVLFVLPIALTLFHSFGIQETALEEPQITSVIPERFGIDGYYDLFIDNHSILHGFWNSVLYAGVITCCNIIVSVPAAYAFLHARFKGRDLLFFLYIVLMMMPLQVTLLPNYIGLRDMKLLNTEYAIILPAIFTPFSAFLMTQYMRGLEEASIEAGMLETSSVIRMLTRIVLPQLRTCVLAVFVFVFAEYWNMVEQPNIYLRLETLKPMSVLLTTSGDMTLSAVLAGSVVLMIPIVILYLYFHDSLEVGLESMKL